MPNITLPTFMSYKTWAAQLRTDLTLVPGVNIPNAFADDRWREWAAIVSENTNLGNVPVPSKLIYPKNEDWKRWATDFISNVPLTN